MGWLNSLVDEVHVEYVSDLTASVGRLWTGKKIGGCLATLLLASEPDGSLP